MEDITDARHPPFFLTKDEVKKIIAKLQSSQEYKISILQRHLEYFSHYRPLKDTNPMDNNPFNRPITIRRPKSVAILRGRTIGKTATKILNDAESEDVIIKSIALFKSLSAIHNLPMGGYAHIVIEDENIEDDDIAFCIDQAKQNTLDDIPESARFACIDALEHFKTLTKSQRKTVLKSNR